MKRQRSTRFLEYHYHGNRRGRTNEYGYNIRRESEILTKVIAAFTNSGDSGLGRPA